MQFTPRDMSSKQQDQSHLPSITIDATKKAICHWWDNNEAGLDMPALKPEKIITEPLGDGRFRISYCFSDLKASVIGVSDTLPL